MSKVWKVIISVSLVLNVFFLVIIYATYIDNVKLKQAVSDLAFELSIVGDYETELEIDTDTVE